MAKVLIISGDEDFSGPLSEQIREQLQLECTVAQDMAEADIVISDGKTQVKNLPESALIWPAERAPYRMGDLLQQVQNALEKEQEKRTVTDGCFYLPRSRQLVGKTASADLTDREAGLLLALLDAGAEGMGKDALLKQVWGFEADINTHTLETHIYRLRGKLREVCDLECIEATQGGYKLT